LTELIDAQSIFLLEIDQLITDKGLSLIEAIVHWSEQRGLEIEYAASMIKKNRAVKTKLREEGEKLRMLKREDVG